MVDGSAPGIDHPGRHAVIAAGETDWRQVVSALVEPSDLGLLRQQELYTHLIAVTTPPPVIDSADFLRDPATHLEWLCDFLAVPFTSKMLSWPPGPRESGAIWAPYWYDAVRPRPASRPTAATRLTLMPPRRQRSRHVARPTTS